MRSGNHYAPLFAATIGIPAGGGRLRSAPVPGRLADKRLVFVTGKGGVGKSTVATALALAAARRGLRAIVAELSGQARAAEAFGVRPPSGEEVHLDGGGLHAISVDMERAMEEYLHERAGRVGDLLAASRTFHAFAHATPGMRELLSVGKVWELAQDRRRVPGARPYDLVVVDAPATGHALGALRAPRTFAEIARVGPIANQGRTIDATLRDPAQTAVVAVALPEEMPVTETLALRRGLRDALGLELSAVIANACLPERLGPRQAKTAAAALADAPAGDAVVRGALQTALSEHARASAQRAQLARLAEGRDGDPPAVELPYVFPRGPTSVGHAAGSGAPGADALDAAALGGLAERLEALL
jgi:anion-transporting  ArsA/GET3 family ATPase